MSRKITLHSGSTMRGSGSYFTPSRNVMAKRKTYKTKRGEGLRLAGARPNPQAQKMWRARRQATIQRRSAAMAQQKAQATKLKEQKAAAEKKVPLKQEGEGMLAPRARVALEDNPLESGHSELKRSLMKFGAALKKKKKKKAKVVKPAQRLKRELLKLVSKQ